MYNRGMDDYTAGVNLVYGPPRLTQFIDRSVQSFNEMIKEHLSEEGFQELNEIRERGQMLLEREGNLALARIAVVVSLYPLSRIRRDPILFSVYIRGWEDQRAASYCRYRHLR